MVFSSICEHASSAFIFASMSSDQICFASSERFVNFPQAGISLLLKGNFVLRQVIWLTPSAKQDNSNRNIPHVFMSLDYFLPLRVP